MKKILLGLIAMVLIIGGAGYTWYKMSYGGTNYYVKISEDGQKVEKRSDSGETFDRYDYKILGYAKNGEQKSLGFDADHNLRKGAYLDMTYNSEKGITSWEEVQEKDVPQKVLNKLK